jgi:DNA-directed RNA polymerase III subunit RPC2
LLITLGLVTGFFTCYGTANIGTSLAWRIPFIILSCLSVLFSVASYLWLVPSPRWLTLSGRQSEASAAWDLLGVSHAEREKVENQLSDTTILEAHIPTGGLNPPAIDSALRLEQDEKKHSFFDVFSKDVRARTALAAFMMAMQQLNGIDGVLYVLPSTFLVC